MIFSEFVTPKWVKTDDGATPSFARFVVEPFERGYGTTIGNSLRRVLLASLEGAAVTAIRIEGVQHEFSAVPGIREDVTDIVLAFKRCHLRLNQNEPLIFSFKHSGEGPITAGKLFAAASQVECFNPDLVLMTAVDPKAVVEMEVKVARGRAYVTAENFEFEHAPLGTIYLDANFSPVLKVNFLVEDARVGQKTDYDRLILDIWTNGSISPELAVQEASNLLIDHLKIFVQQEVSADRKDAGAGDSPEMNRLLSRSVDELELSVRASNCLKAANIKSIGDLVSYQESQMLQFHNFGKKSLDEIKAVLESLGLALGMNAANNPMPDPAPVAVSGADDIDDEDEEDDE